MKVLRANTLCWTMIFFFLGYLSYLKISDWKEKHFFYNSYHHLSIEDPRWKKIFSSKLPYFFSKKVYQKYKVAVLFCDLRNFTQLCADNEGKKNFTDFLTTYFKNVCRIIWEYNGILHQIVGDGVVALYMAESESNYQKVCDDVVRCAFAINNFTKSFDVSSFNLKGVKKNRVENGIGVSFGDVAFVPIKVGLVKDRIIVGDAMNLASRLQDLTKKNDIRQVLKEQVIVSEDVYNFLSDRIKPLFSFLKKELIKGYGKKIALFGVTK